MSRRVRVKMAGLVFASTVAWGIVVGTACSVDRAGLASNDGSTSAGGSAGGALATGGHPGGTTGHGGASGSSGGTGGGGGVPVVGQGGTGEQAGGSGGGPQTSGTGGSAQTGGAAGDASGGSTGTGGIDAGAVAGSGGSSGTGGAAGSPVDTGGSTGAGGTSDTGGATGTGGDTGTGGASGTGGAAGSGGGTGGSPAPSCAGFPAGASFVTPTDGLLHCYWVHADMTDWNSAEGQCTGERGSLATILSSEENMFVFQILVQAKLFIMNGVSLGATDGKQNDDKTGPGQYAWVTGEQWGYTNWHAGQPDGSCTCTLMQNCACDHTLVMSNDGTWYDRPESTARPYICEAIAH